MDSTLTLEVDFFGAFKQYLADPHLSVEVPVHATVKELRIKIQSALESRLGRFDEALLNASAIGSDERILSNSDSLRGLRKVAVLPPVSGG